MLLVEVHRERLHTRQCSNLVDSIAEVRVGTHADLGVDRVSAGDVGHEGRLGHREQRGAHRLHDAVDRELEIGEALKAQQV